MLTLDTAFGRKLIELINDEIEGEKDNMAAGLMDHDAYKFSAGKVSGLLLCAELCNDVNKFLQER